MGVHVYIARLELHVITNKHEPFVYLYMYKQYMYM